MLRTKNASMSQTDKPYFHGHNILVKEINRLKFYTMMSCSHKYYEEVCPFLDGVVRKRITEEVTFEPPHLKEVKIQPNRH